MSDLYLPDIPTEERSGACASLGHPGNCFNPWMRQTWCLCGAVTYPGDAVDWALTRNDGPLTSWIPNHLKAQGGVAA